jgi:hypothetical protein
MICKKTDTSKRKQFFSFLEDVFLKSFCSVQISHVVFYVFYNKYLPTILIVRAFSCVQYILSYIATNIKRWRHHSKTTPLLNINHNRLPNKKPTTAVSPFLSSKKKVYHSSRTVFLLQLLLDPILALV